MNKEKRGRSVWKKILTLTVALSMALGMAPAAYAQEGSQPQKTYVALGDSISTGCGLTEGVGFTGQVAEDNDLSLVSLASDGETSETLLTKLKDPASAAAVMKADVITITVGGNDFMNALYSFLQTKYNEENPNAQMTAEQIKTHLLAGNLQMVSFAAGVLPGFASSAEVRAAAAGFTANLSQILAGIRAVNPDVSLIVATQYNPYTYLAAQLADNPFFADSAAAINEVFESGVTLLNGVIRKAAEGTEAYVADAYTAFRSAAEEGVNPCNASFAMMKLNLDFHPNADGHRIITKLVNEILADIPVDIPCDHVPQADDGDCTTEVVCSLCGEVLVPAKDSHSFGEWTGSGDGVHGRVCTNEGCTVTETENCFGGTAQIGKKPVCKVCGSEYGEALKAEDKPETDAGKDTQGDELNKNGNPAAPVTGDAADPVLMLMLLVLCCGTAGAVAVSKKRN